MALAYLFATSHTALLLRWRRFPWAFRAASLMWAVQSWNRVLWGDRDMVWVMRWWMPLEAVTLVAVAAAAIECAWRELGRMDEHGRREK